MDQAVKAKWVAALRSGEYEQAKGVLKAGEKSFCCLGVLCNLSPTGQWEDVSERDPEDDDDSAPRFCGDRNSDSELPPFDVCDWAGFPNEDSQFISARIPDVTIDGKSMQLHKHNDMGVTFDQLADAIEEQL